MSAPIRRPGGTEASASLLALAVALLITTLATGCLRLVIGATRVAERGAVPPTAVTELASAASEVAATLSAGDRAAVMAVISALSGAALRDASIVLGKPGASEIRSREHSVREQILVPINPVIADPRDIERVYAERTGSDSRARRFTSEITELLFAGTLLTESDIRHTAGIDYPLIVGLITGEPVLNVNTAPAPLLEKLPEIIAPDDSGAADAIRQMIRGILDERNHREISAEELGSAIETAASRSRPAGRVRLIGQLTAYLGVRTWVWELELARDEWRGTAVIAHLPGHPVATVLGLAVDPIRPTGRPRE